MLLLLNTSTAMREYASVTLEIIKPWTNVETNSWERTAIPKKIKNKK